MTIKKFVYEISLDYFKGKGAPKDHCLWKKNR